MGEALGVEKLHDCRPRSRLHPYQRGETIAVYAHHNLSEGVSIRKKPRAGR